MDSDGKSINFSNDFSNINLSTNPSNIHVDEDDDDGDIEFCPVGDSQLRTTSELALPTPDMESVLDRVSPLKTMDKEAPDSPSSRRDSLASNKSGKSRMVKGPGQGGSKS